MNRIKKPLATLFLLVWICPGLSEAKSKKEIVGGGDQVGNGRVDEMKLCRKDPVLGKEICVTKKKSQEIKNLMENGWKEQKKKSKKKMPDSF